MNLYEVIENRCSVRSYQGKPIEQDKLERILNAGRLAPSARNRQEWKFVVVRDASLRQQIAEAAEQPFLAQAGVIIAAVSTEPTHVMSCGVESAPVDCAIALDHMSLAATCEGLGSCWIGHFDQDASKKALGVPDSHRIIELMPIGYSAANPSAKARKPLEQVVCYDRFE